eukprot:CAMPEP_0195508292 /NCGR_PEP_ID=MMETSP0794_2-20130614/1534_1 /TAXON_ID=515487 /ORGANISM="Stephanopyxis turris, Strain CCMP 815" /LENGTH=243 /DNA_ID=CAMNT_0040635209 /DNA_START=47 /DNA_END=778 /DNA_ORIENTATION=+
MRGLVAALAPTGKLRVGINLSNFLLVSSRGPSGEPIGVAPGIAHAVAKKLGVPVELVPYANPGLLCDDVTKDKWDIGLLGSEPARAKSIAFTAPYCEIEATFLVRNREDLQSCADVDSDDVRIAVSARSAYDLWLTENLKSATLERTDEPGLVKSLEMFQNGKYDALAGLRPWLLDQVQSVPGGRVLPDKFTAVQQSIGIPRSRADGDGPMWLERFVMESISSGLVSELIEKHGVEGKLSVAR